MRKIFLPVNQALRDSLEPPTVTAMRKRLGGRVEPAPDARHSVGDCVELASGGGARVGVVLHSSADRADVYLDHGVVHRAPSEALSPAFAPPTPALAIVAAKARVFGALSEGSAILVLPLGQGGQHGQEPSAPVRATLREKCRYGALVETADGAILGVGFQRLDPASG